MEIINFDLEKKSFEINNCNHSKILKNLRLLSLVLTFNFFDTFRGNSNENKVSSKEKLAII